MTPKTNGVTWAEHRDHKKFARKLIRQNPPHLRHVATLPWEIKNSNYLQMWKKCKQIAFFNRLKLCYSSTNFDIFGVHNCSAAVEMGNRLATIDMGRKLGVVPLQGAAGSQSNTMLPGPRPTSVPSGILIHQPFGHSRHGPKVGGCTPFGGGRWVPI